METKKEAVEAIKSTGVTAGDAFVATQGTGRQTRYFAYDPGAVKGLDAVRENGEAVGEEVSNHDEAVVEQLSKDEARDLVLGADNAEAGLLVSVSQASPDEGGDAGGLGDLIRENYEEHGFWAENDDGESLIVSLASPGPEKLRYLTASHLGRWDLTVDEYKELVADALGAENPENVPVAPDDVRESFATATDFDEETRERIGEQVKQRWEDGEYDHLRGSQGGGDGE